MLKTLSVNLQRSIKSVKLLENYNVNIELPAVEQMAAAEKTEQNKLAAELEVQRRLYDDTNRTLKALVAKLNNFYEEVFAGHKEQIARLSVEIARKVLMQKVKDGDYEIESIVKEVLSNAPSRQDVVIYVNPEDLAACQKVQDDDTFEDIKFSADSNIERAECRLESPKGIIKSLINEHLEQIEKTLTKTD